VRPHRPRTTIATGAALGLRQLGARRVDRLREHPSMAERVDDRRVAVAMPLVRGRPHGLCARVDRALVRVVDVDDLEVHRHRRATPRQRTDEIELGILVGEHQARAADDELGVADAPVVSHVAIDLDRAEHIAVPVDGFCGAGHHQVRREW
jgi:hypothetical protein